MKKIYAMALLAACCLGATTAKAQNEAEQKAWMAYMTPGKAHKLMATEAGTWNNEMTFWHEPGSEAVRATSMAEITMLFDGRYQETNYRGEVMGMPFQGKNLLAYDNVTKEYISTWIDNMGTGMLITHGKPDKSGKAITFTGQMVNPVDGKTTPVRQVYTLIDANTTKLEMFDTKNGKEFKSMEITMRRKS